MTLNTATKENAPTVALPRYPASWYHFARSADIVAGSPRPVAREIAGRRFAGYRRRDGRVAVLDARCCHFGSDLGNGTVRDDLLECSFHGWCFDHSGRCVHIPSAREIPCWAGQTSYPVVERFGEVFLFLGSRPLFPFPDFEGRSFSDLHASAAFTFEPKCPWYMVVANGFDAQHFRMAHERELIGEPVIDHPHPFAMRVKLHLRVVPATVADRFIRAVCGETLEFSIVAWGGTIAVVQARFPQTVSYGLLTVEPISAQETRIRNTVFVEKSASRFARAVVDPVHAAVRRALIRRFLRADLHRVTGTYFAPGRCIEADHELQGYFSWLQSLPALAAECGE